MSSYTDNLPIILFAILGVGLCLFCAFLELLKGRIPHAETNRGKVNSFSLGALVILLFGIGSQWSLLKVDPFFYVLYWWATFTLALSLFLLPFLKFREFLNPQLPPPKGRQKISVQISPFMKKPPPDITIQAPLEEVNQNPLKPPTVH